MEVEQGGSCQRCSRAAKIAQGLWVTIISVATLLMGYFAISFYDQYRLAVSPTLGLTESTSSANAYLAGAVGCLLLTIFLAYMAVRHRRPQRGRSVTPAKGGDVRASDLITQLHSANESIDAMRKMLDQRDEVIQAQTKRITDLVVVSRARQTSATSS